MSRTGGRLAVLVLVPAIVLAAAGARAGEADEATLDVLKRTLRSNREAFVAVNLDLTDDEARGFWPVYERYQTELSAVGDRLLQVIEEYRRTFGSTSDEEARKLVDEYLAVERDRVQVRQSYLEPFAEVLPGRKLMRFYQLENKIDAVLRYDLAASIPVIDR